MSCYVDPLSPTPRTATWRWDTGCHLLCTDENELHDVARRIGLDRAWAQHPGTGDAHYDLTPARREQVLRMGLAKEVTKKVMASLFSGRRRQHEVNERCWQRLSDATLQAYGLDRNKWEREHGGTTNPCRQYDL